MTSFDASGCPSEFLSRIRKHEADLEDKKNLIAKEKQLIKDLEEQIEEKEKTTNDLETENANLECEIEHLHALHAKQEDSNKRLLETRELLKEQAKSQAEKYEAVKQESQHTREICEKIYDDYMMKFIETMDYYETLSNVREYKEKMSEIIELRKVLDNAKKEEESLKEEVQLLQEKKESMKPKFSLSEWGIKLKRAELHREVKKVDLDEAHKNIETLEEEITILQEKKKAKDEEKARDAARKAELTRFQKSKSSTPTVSPMKPSVPTLPGEQPSTSKSTVFKPYSVPDFRSFFKDRSSDHKRGSSGSSLASPKVYTAPNFSSFLSPIQPKKKQTAVTESQSSSGSTASEATSTISCAPSKLSLSSLLSQPKKPAPGYFLTGRPLSEWLNPPKPVDSETAVQENDKEKAKVVKEVPAKDSHASSWSMNAFSHARMTEKPLLRQVQEKMLQVKLGKEKEPVAVVEDEKKNEEASSPVGSCEDDVNTVGEETQEQEKPNMLTRFDGPSYEALMATEDEEKSTPLEIKSPKHISIEEHNRMMAEIQKSPEDIFRYQANIMSMEGADSSSLISPPHPESSKFAPTPSNSQMEGFQFTIPNEPPPTNSKRSWESGDFFGARSEQSPEKSASPTKFQGFSFGNQEENSSSSSNGFNFGAVPAQESSSAASPFSFSFGGSSATSPPDRNDGGVFSFGAAQAKSPPDGSNAGMFSFGGNQAKSPDEQSSSGFFSASMESEDTSSSSSFMSLFAPSI